MNKWLIFIAGIFVGVILTGFYNNIKLTSKSPESENSETVNEQDGVKMFDEPGEIFNETSFKVFQVIADNAALVRCNSKYDLYTGTVCLLINKEGKLYYDDEIIKCPKNMVVRQMGIYQYPTKNDMIKTVPIIMIMGK